MMRWIGKRKHLRNIVLVLLDAAIVAASMLAGALLRFDCSVPPEHARSLLLALPWMTLCYIAVYWAGGTYRVLWRYATGKEYISLGLYTLAALVLTLGIDWVFSTQIPRSLLVLTGAFTYGFSAISRYIWRMLCSFWKKPDATEEQTPRRLLVVGAGSAGSWMVAQCRQQRYGIPVAFADDNPAKRGMRIQGIPVLGTAEDIPRIAQKEKVDDIIIAIPSLSGSHLRRVATLCLSTHCRVTTMSAPKEIGLNGKAKAPIMRKLNMADFLSRDEVRLNTESISGYLKGSAVLVTGGGGSIGSEICRQVMRYFPKQLIILDMYENCAYELLYELRRQYGSDVPVAVEIGSVRDRKRLDEIMRRFRPDVVFHAAAHKHVPLMEESPAEAVKNNVFGTRNTLLSAEEHGVNRFVLLSTDKAVNPTNVMGATKRITEMLIQTLGAKTKMKCMAVRFGNVLGSHGSVIPLFEEQIRSGGPVTVTDPEMTRFFMTIPEAAQLVLQAGGIAQRGAIFVLDMGEPVRILDLARQLIRFYGYEPEVDIAIEITGLRPGEKLYEELMMDAEADKMTRTAHDLIFVARPIQMDEAAFFEHLMLLEKLCDANTEDMVRALANMVDTFKPQCLEQAG